MTNNVTRRFFGLSSAASVLAARAASPKSSEKPALLGGKPVRRESFPRWPILGDGDLKSWMAVLRSGAWNRRRAQRVTEFEETWAKLLGAKYCLATNGGTSSLYTALNALDIGPKDEVLVPPYTFIATPNVVLLQHALPIFVDTDPETFQIDANQLEAAITPRTRAILPVHMGGASADMDKILAVARKHNLSVVEDACQAHLAEWRGRKVSTLGEMGCFSFQASKNLNCGEGGALITNDDQLIARADRFHTNGGTMNKSSQPIPHRTHGCNLRMTEFQGTLLLSQMERLEKQAQAREQNAQYLTQMLDEIPGIAPARMYKGCTRNAYHLYMFRYDAARFDGLPRSRFIEALKAEGVPCSSGYTPLNKDPFLKYAFESRPFKAIYSAREIAAWHERNHTRANDRLCEEAVWLTQRMLLGTRRDMEQIGEAIRKIRHHAAALRTS